MFVIARPQRRPKARTLLRPARERARRLCPVLGALVLTLLGCRSKDEQPPSAEPRPGSKAAPAPSAATAPLAPPEAPERVERQPIENPRANLAARAVLQDPPLERFGSTQVPEKYWVHQLRGGILATQGNSLFELDDHELVEKDPIAADNQRAGILWREVDELKGSWPDNVWASVSGEWVSDGARIYDAFGDTLRGEYGAWAVVDDRYESISAWSGGRVVGLVRGQFAALGAKGPLPKPAPNGEATCAVKVTAEGIAALPSGDFYSIGHGCDGKRLFVEHWAPDELESKSVQVLPAYFSGPLPGASEQSRLRVWLEAASPTRLYALKSSRSRGPGLAHLAWFDGTAWAALPLPIDASIDASKLGTDGSLWLLMAERVFVFHPKTRWREVELPKPPPLPAELKGSAKVRTDVTSLAAVDAERAYFGVVHVYADSPDATIAHEAASIMSTDPKPLSVKRLASSQSGGTGTGSSSTGADAGASPGEPSVFSQGCSTPFVILFSVSDSAPKDFAYPATRDALLGAAPPLKLEFVEFLYKGRRTLGARAPSASEGERLVQLITARVKGSKPTLVCFDPASIVRQVKLP